MDEKSRIAVSAKGRALPEVVGVNKIGGVNLNEFVGRHLRAVERPLFLYFATFWVMFVLHKLIYDNVLYDTPWSGGVKEPVQEKIGIVKDELYTEPTLEIAFDTGPGFLNCKSRGDTAHHSKPTCHEFPNCGVVRGADLHRQIRFVPQEYSDIVDYQSIRKIVEPMFADFVLAAFDSPLNILNQVLVNEVSESFLIVDLYMRAEEIWTIRRPATQTFITERQRIDFHVDPKPKGKSYRPPIDNTNRWRQNVSLHQCGSSTLDGVLVSMQLLGNLGVGSHRVVDQAFRNSLVEMASVFNRQS